MQEVSDVYTSPFLDIDEPKLVFCALRLVTYQKHVGSEDERCRV